LNQIFNFYQPKNPSLFLFPFFFSILTRRYSFSYLSDSSHTLSHIFSSVQSTVWLNHAFGPPTQFPLIIFNLKTLATSFGLPSRTAIHYVIRLRHRGAASPPPPLPLRKWPHPKASPSRRH
jgi:hypothetical protein